MSWADIAFYRTMEWPDMMGIKVDLAKYPKLHALYKKVGSNPKIKAWEEKRPKTQF